MNTKVNVAEKNRLHIGLPLAISETRTPRGAEVMVSVYYDPKPADMKDSGWRIRSVPPEESSIWDGDIDATVVALSKRQIAEELIRAIEMGNTKLMPEEIVPARSSGGYSVASSGSSAGSSVNSGRRQKKA